MFSFKFCEIFKNSYFAKHLQTAASVLQVVLVFLLLIFEHVSATTQQIFTCSKSTKEIRERCAKYVQS